MWEGTACHLQWIVGFEIKRVVRFLCPQISGSQIWLHIYLIWLKLSPEIVIGWCWEGRGELYLSRVLLWSLNWAPQLWLRTPRGWDQLDAISLVKRPDQANLVIYHPLHCIALSWVQCALSSQPCKEGKTGYLSPLHRWRNRRSERFAESQMHIKSEADPELQTRPLRSLQFSQQHCSFFQLADPRWVSSFRAGNHFVSKDQRKKQETQVMAKNDNPLIL